MPSEESGGGRLSLLFQRVSRGHAAVPGAEGRGRASVDGNGHQHYNADGGHEKLRAGHAGFHYEQRQQQ